MEENAISEVIFRCNFRCNRNSDVILKMWNSKIIVQFGQRGTMLSRVPKFTQTEVKMTKKLLDTTEGQGELKNWNDESHKWARVIVWK